MQAQIQVGPLLSDEDWTDLAELMGADESLLVQQLLGDYRAAGAKAYLRERAYIDRDFMDSEPNIRNKISRGKFTAVFLVQCLEAIGASSLRLD